MITIYSSNGYKNRNNETPILFEEDVFSGSSKKNCFQIDFLIIRQKKS